jgi:hypothetical protein
VTPWLAAAVPAVDSTLAAFMELEESVQPVFVAVVSPGPIAVAIAVHMAVGVPA